MITLSRPRGVRLFFTLRGSILPRVIKPLALCVAVAALVTFSHGVLFHWKVTLTAVPFSIIGLALAICLGFRNNVAYDRSGRAASCGASSCIARAASRASCRA